ncbi:MAG: hypothetical protein EP343_15010 [Deltaproteobacteria bacterium]|nr:MAG: hypothetical protein EP343_15010 [Deltaproteobacteria bacterium]
MMWNRMLAVSLLLGAWLWTSAAPSFAQDKPKPRSQAVKAPKAQAPQAKKPAQRPAPKAKAKAQAKVPASRPASRPTVRITVVKMSAKEKLVQKFWESVVLYDFQALFGITGVPFVNDNKCAIFAKFQDLEDFLREKKVPKEVTIGRPTVVKSGYTKSAFVRSALDTLSPATTNCEDPKSNKLIDAINQYEVDFVLVTLTVGKTQIPTMMRLNKIKGRWLVTGLVN